MAISITDLETIQLQILKLSPMKKDSKIEEILTLLQSESYGQAQALINDYIETSAEEIQQRSTKSTLEPEISKEDQAIIDEFKLFVTPGHKETTQTVEVDINDYVSKETNITKEQASVDYDTLLSLDADDVLSDNIDIDISHTQEKKETEDIFFQTPDKEESIDFLTDNHVPKDTFFEERETGLPKKEDSLLDFEAMPHIAQKLINMNKHYPPVEISHEKFDTVEALIDKIAQEGYNESEMEETLAYVDKLIKDKQHTEASQLLLVCGATKSKFAQFMLARELYKGLILTKNVKESFILMDKLAKEEYPEALCDLGQFYENGIGIPQDLAKAEKLYKEASDLGIKRAKKHYSRLKKTNRSIF